MIVFGLIFFLAIASLQKNINLFGIIGIPAEVEDWLIIVLCIGSIIKIVYELIMLDK
ncbi:MAG: hypothetical protein ACP5NV_03145 [Candidatus Woesearchaeota archaeon]